MTDKRDEDEKDRGEAVPEWTTHTDGTQNHVSGKAKVYNNGISVGDSAWRWEVETNNFAARFDRGGDWGTCATAEKARAEALDYLARHPDEPEQPLK